MKQVAVMVALAFAASCGGVPRGGGPPESPPFMAAFSGMDSVRATTLAPGLVHVYARDVRGPWAIHVVAAEVAACGPVLQARRPAGPLSSRDPTSGLAGGALVTVNADFFRLPGGTPVGPHVSGGVPHIGPTDWPAFAVTPSGEWRAGSARVAGHARVGGDSTGLVQVNRPAEAFSSYAGTVEGVTLFTVRADTLPPDSTGRLLRLRLVAGAEREGRGVVVAGTAPAERTAVAAGEVLLLAHGTAREWAARRRAGDTVAWRAAVVIENGGEAAAEAVGGFPLLLRDGVEVLGTQDVREAFGLARHPRTAIGWDAGQRILYLVVVDGRQPPYSDGMTLPELTRLFRRLGATDALNLDGGGSTAMVVAGTVVNRPSDAEGERAVGNALSLVRCTAPQRQ